MATLNVAVMDILSDGEQPAAPEGGHSDEPGVVAAVSEVPGTWRGLPSGNRVPAA